MARQFKCAECSAVFERKTWTNRNAPICSEACKKARRAKRTKKVEMTCAECSTPITLSGRLGLEAARRGRGYCSEECKRVWLSRESSQRMARTNRQYASARMKERNPMRNSDVRERVSDLLRAMKHSPPIRGGNGTGPSPMEARLLSALPAEWVLSLAVPTRTGRGSGYPNHYKLDLALPSAMLGVEIDGASHCALSRQEQDAKKQDLLESLGWTVLRFTNDQVQTDLDRCVQTILSTTSKLTAITTTSSMAS